MKEFTKADLKDGMVVEFDDGFRGLVLGFKIVGENSFGLLSDLTSDMKINGCQVIKVYEINKKAMFYLNDIFGNALELIWKKPTKRMTVEGMKARLEELLGEKIEVEPTWNEMIGWLYCYCDSQDMDCYKCNLKEKCYNLGSKFENYSLETLKQCYEKVITDGNT